MGWVCWWGCASLGQLRYLVLSRTKLSLLQDSSGAVLKEKLLLALEPHLEYAQ